MLKLTDRQVQEIFDGLNNGKSYCGIKDNRGVGRITTISSRCFQVQYYGSIHIRKTIKSLKNAIEVMFCYCDEIVEAVFSEYHCNYVPVDEKYERIDVSWRHPNTFNK